MLTIAFCELLGCLPISIGIYIGIESEGGPCLGSRLHVWVILAMIGNYPFNYVFESYLILEKETPKCRCLYIAYTSLSRRGV
jgi:hypothetical protein